jgi:hypothetical protein
MIVVSSVAFLVLLAFVAFTSVALYQLISEPQIVPEWNIAQCSPLTENPKRLWAIWNTGAENMPIFAKETVKMWRHITGPDWEIRVVHTNYNHSDDPCYYLNYVSSDMVPKRMKEMIPQHQADSVRLALIRVHGGVYMDISVILLHPLESIFWENLTLPKSHPNNSALGGFFMWNAQKMFEVWMFAALPEEPIIVAWHDLYLKFLNSNDTTVRNVATKEINPILKGWNDTGVDSRHFKYYCISWIMKVALAQNPDILERFETKAQTTDAKLIIYSVFERWGWTNKEFWLTPELRSDNADRYIRDNNPVFKFITHGSMFIDNEYHTWRNLHTNIGYVRMLVAKRGHELEKVNRDWKTHGIPLTEHIEG